MKVQEFIEKFNEHDVEIKEYLPVMKKRDLVMDVIATCTYDLDGFITVDRLQKKVCLEMFVLREYAGVDIATNFDELMEEYDLLRQSARYGDYEYMINLEQYEIENMLEDELAEMLRENSVEAQVSRILLQVNDLMKTLGDKFEDFDLNSLLPEGTDASKLMEYLDVLK